MERVRCKNTWHSVLCRNVDTGCSRVEGQNRWWNGTEHKSSKRGRTKAMNNIGRERQKWMGNNSSNNNNNCSSVLRASVH